MTRFYINQKEITPPPGISSFEQILEHVDEDQLPPNSVIRLVSFDGRPVLQEALYGNSPEIFQQISGVEKVEIITGTVEEITRESISEAFEYLDRVEAGIPTLALKFQTEPGPEAFEGLRQLYDGFYWLNLLLDKLSTNFRIDFNEVPVLGVPAREHNRRYISTLKQMQESQERGDRVMISDLLEYEIASLVPVWREMFQIISERTETKQ